MNRQWPWIVSLLVSTCLHSISIKICLFQHVCLVGLEESVEESLSDTGPAVGFVRVMVAVYVPVLSVSHLQSLMHQWIHGLRFQSLCCSLVIQSQEGKESSSGNTKSCCVSMLFCTVKVSSSIFETGEVCQWGEDDNLVKNNKHFLVIFEINLNMLWALLLASARPCC